MNLENAKRELQAFLRRININFDVETTPEMVIVTATGVSLGSLDDDISIRIVAFEADNYAIEFVFDKVPSLAEAAELINDFNRDVPWLKACVNEKGYLTFSTYGIFLFDEQSLIQNVGFILNYVGGDNFIEKVRPLTTITV